MIAKQSIGKSFSGALNYNLKKMNSQDPKKRAELLVTNFTSMEKAMIRKELAVMKALNPKLKRNTWHTSLNFAIGENISNDKMKSIAEKYMKQMGFDNNLHFIFRHHDTAHAHCHILALRNKFDGTVVSDSHNYQKSEVVIRALETRYHLVKIKSSKHSKNKALNKDELEMIQRTGTPSNKLLLQEKVRDAIIHSRSINEFIHQLESHGISVLFNQASTGRVSGITYQISGFKIRGQALGNQFKFGSITKEINYEQNRDGQAISQANSRTREKYEAGRKTIQSRPDIRPGVNNDSSMFDSRKSKKNGRLSEDSFTGNRKQQETVDADQKGAKENTTDLDNGVSHDCNSDISFRDNLINSIFSIQIINPVNENDKKRKRKRNR